MINFIGEIKKNFPFNSYEKIGLKFIMLISVNAPTKANIIAGIPNLNKTNLSAFFPTKNNLKILLNKCTTPVSAIAKSTGKKIINIGERIVPNPNPEKNVSIATKKTKIETKNISKIEKEFL